MSLRFSPPDAETALVLHGPRSDGGLPGHRIQRRFAELLATVDEEAEPALATMAGDVALDVTLALPNSQSLTSGQHIDNWLLLVVSRLGQRRIPAAFGRKVHGDTSTLRFGAAKYRPTDDPPMMEVAVRGSPVAHTWAEQIGFACKTAVDRHGAPPGPITLDVAFTLSSAHNWTMLWKPTIDALGHLLGTPDTEHPCATNDDRIVTLGLHRTTTNSVGHDVLVTAWWASAAGTTSPDN